MRQRPLLTLAVLAALLCSAGISHELWTPDEPRVAEIGRAMWASGDWAMPRLGGEPFLEKPPLYWWVQSGVFALAGRTDAALARVPSALCAFLTALLTYALGRRYFDRVAALLGALVLLTMSEFAITSHWIVVDNALVTAVTAAFACFAHARGRRGGPRALCLAGMYVALAAAFLSKGVIGLAIPALGMAAHLLWTRSLREFAGWHLVAGGLFVLGVAGAWLFALWLDGGDDALRTFLVYNQLGRFLPGAFEYEGGHTRPIWYYAVNAPAHWMPWTPFLALALVSARRCWNGFDARAREGIQLCLSASVPAVLALSLAGTKRGMYLDPICPPLALLVGAWMVWPAQRSRWENRIEHGWWLALVSLCAASFATIVVALVLVSLSPVSIPPIVVTRGFWPWSALGVSLLAAFAWLWRRAPPSTRVDRHVASTVLVVLTALQLFLTIPSFVDRYKSFVPFVEALREYVPADRPVYAYRPDETLLGVVGFYTHRIVTPIEMKALEELAESSETQWVVVRDRRQKGGNYAAIQRAEIPHRLVSEQVVGNRRTLRILALGAMNTASERAPGGNPQ
ncbi:MAG: glycosyltransferase family 39 protein [Myxococcales bacterium]|nr:glycosyltransferase family 39 protein [Myxococcales bacterium]